MTATATELQHVRALVAAVPDPELPMVSIEDLGILRDVRLAGAGPYIKEILARTGFTSYFPIYDDLVAAVGSF